MINVIIADHQAIFRAGVAKVLAVEEDLRIVGQPLTPEAVLNALDKLRPQVVILSTGFINLLSEVQDVAQRRQSAVLVICDNNENASDFMRMGVQGVIYRSASGNMVVEAVRRLAQGQAFLQGPNSSEVEVNEDMVGMRVRNRLSERELRIIAAIVQGYKNREIAAQLYTTEQVVKNALRNIFDKIGVSDRLELALFVVHHRILAQATASVPLTPLRPQPAVAAVKGRMEVNGRPATIH
ncbi:MAG: response regulator transcription factor [Candidatus Korobacteraceae bacterium]